MNKWQSKLDISDLIDAYENEQINVKELSQGIAARLSRNTFFFENTQLREIADKFNEFNNQTTHEEFNDQLNELFDFGDEKKRIWVNTFLDNSESEDEDKDPSPLYPWGDSPPLTGKFGDD